MFCEFRFLLFGHNSFDAMGGFDDFIFGFNSISEFESKIKEKSENLFDRYDMVDLTNLEQYEIDEIESFRRDHLSKEKRIESMIEKIGELTKSFM